MDLNEEQCNVASRSGEDAGGCRLSLSRSAYESLVLVVSLRAARLCRRRTAYAKVQARLQFPDDYPTASASPIVELTSSSLPQPFLRKLTMSAEEAARACPVAAGTDDSRGGSGGGAGGKGKAVAALRVVIDVVNKNKFLPCWKELRQSANLVKSR